MSSHDNLSARASGEKFFSTRILSTVLDMTGGTEGKDPLSYASLPTKYGKSLV